MKKLVILALVLFMATSCFAEVKLFKFMQDGKVVGVTYSNKDGNVIPPVGATAVEIVEFEKDATIAQQKADLPVPPDTSVIMQGIFGIFQNKLATAGSYAGTIQLLMQFQNWAGISALRDQLIAGGIIIKAEADQVNQLFLDQGIILPK
jgi:hypothetical protein